MMMYTRTRTHSDVLCDVHSALQIVPYFVNICSSINITRQIDGSESISEYTKSYFRAKNKLYTILVLLCGGAFPALKLMSSNLFGMTLFSAGFRYVICWFISWFPNCNEPLLHSLTSRYLFVSCFPVRLSWNIFALIMSSLRF